MVSRTKMVSYPIWAPEVSRRLCITTTSRTWYVRLTAYWQPTTAFMRWLLSSRSQSGAQCATLICARSPLASLSLLSYTACRELFRIWCIVCRFDMCSKRYPGQIRLYLGRIQAVSGHIRPYQAVSGPIRPLRPIRCHTGSIVLQFRIMEFIINRGDACGGDVQMFVVGGAKTVTLYPPSEALLLYPAPQRLGTHYCLLPPAALDPSSEEVAFPSCSVCCKPLPCATPQSKRGNGCC